MAKIVVDKQTPKVPWYKQLAQSIGEGLGQFLFGGQR